MTERSSVEELFANQEAERQEFVREQVDRLNEVGFDWNLPKGFEKETGYGGKGLITINYSYYFEVLTPEEGLIRVQRGMPNRPVLLLGGGMTGSGIVHLQHLEDKVDEVITQRTEQRPSSPLRRLLNVKLS
jgi:hypothetical protein